MLTPIKNNPKLSILGVILLVGLIITSYPEVITELPDGVEGYVKSIAAIVAIIAGFMGFRISPNLQSTYQVKIEPPAPKAEVVPEEEENKDK